MKNLLSKEINPFTIAYIVYVLIQYMLYKKTLKAYFPSKNEIRCCMSYNLL